MKYIFLFLTISLFFIGCDNKKEQKSYNKTIKNNQDIIESGLNFKNLNYKFNDTKLLLFVNQNHYSKLQIKTLQKLKVKFYIINNKRLKKFFKIKVYPTIVMTKDKNHIKTYEGFIPYEILKYEIKDKNVWMD